MMPFGLAGTMAVAIATAETATEKMAATKRLEISEFENMGHFPFNFCLFGTIPLDALHSA
jgi:hypothetical protein